MGRCYVAIENAQYDILGQLLIEAVPSSAERILLYVEYEPGVVGPFLAYEQSGTVRQVMPDTLFDELTRLQGIFGDDVRAFEFFMLGDKFEAKFHYDERMMSDVEVSVREDEVLLRRFGHANVVPAPWK
jgi:hypothetical protein